MPCPVEGTRAGHSCASRARTHGLRRAWGLKVLRAGTKIRLEGNVMHPRLTLGKTTSYGAIALACALALGAMGCSTVRGSAVATGPRQPAYSGPVSIYAANQVPPGATDLGVVEVSAAQAESTVSVLLPVFVQKVAQIGGNIAKIDGIRAHFELVTRTHLETYYYSCGVRVQCAGQRMYTTNDEIVVVSMMGHAYSDRGSEAAPVAPASAEPSPPPPVPSPVPAPVPDEGGTSL